MPKPVCVKCQRFFRPKKNGVVLLEQMPVETSAEPGTIDPTAWEPYKLWQADLWICHGCDTEIIVGFGANHFGENFEPQFGEAMKFVTHTVNDC